ncbi:MAG TPA: tRNA (guanine(46)-N(7))-methyltransferase TrmB [Paracoccaceae bacterium]|nr:tRNA (guanine(46)-N(7))-methyltransferase TrmB [Paracoccaceae bacterium]
MADGERKAAAAVWRNFYGRRHGKALRAEQKRLLAELLPRLQVPGVAPPGDPGRRPVDIVRLFGDARPVWLEIGFGAGEHMLAMAAANPGVRLIGAEPYVNGVAAFLSHHASAEVENIRVHAGDARDLLELLPAGSVARAFLLYPDPWPKKRHAKRRFVNPEGMDLLARVLMPRARFHLATDMDIYVEHAATYMATRGDFERVARDPHVPWPDWHRTRYEAKATREGRLPHYLTFLRL